MLPLAPPAHDELEVADSDRRRLTIDVDARQDDFGPRRRHRRVGGGDERGPRVDAVDRAGGEQRRERGVGGAAFGGRVAGDRRAQQRAVPVTHPEQRLVRRASGQAARRKGEADAAEAAFPEAVLPPSVRVVEPAARRAAITTSEAVRAAHAAIVIREHHDRLVEHRLLAKRRRDVGDAFVESVQHPRVQPPRRVGDCCERRDVRSRHLHRLVDGLPRNVEEERRRGRRPSAEQRLRARRVHMGLYFRRTRWCSHRTRRSPGRTGGIEKPDDAVLVVALVAVEKAEERVEAAAPRRARAVRISQVPEPRNECTQTRPRRGVGGGAAYHFPTMCVE